MEFRAWASLALIALVLIAPSGGAPSVFVNLEKFFTRIANPVTEQERAELSFLACLEEAGSVIPGRKNVEIIAPDAYFTQRSQEILYPRVRLVSEDPDYIFAIASEISGEVIGTVACGGQEVKVAKVD